MYTYEYTGTFGGEANYSWVKRGEFELAPGAKEREVIRIAKMMVGITGVPCKKEYYGDTIVLRPDGCCTVLFIYWTEG